MTETRFFSFDELKKYFQTGKLTNDLLLRDYQGIASVADLLHFVEEIRKEIIPYDVIYQKRLEKLIEEGYVYFPELDNERLLETLFEINEETFELWSKAANKNITPRYSLSLLALRITDYIHWTEDVFEQMKDYFENMEKK